MKKKKKKLNYSAQKEGRSRERVGRVERTRNSMGLARKIGGCSPSRRERISGGSLRGL